MDALEHYSDRLAVLTCVAVLVIAVLFGAHAVSGSDSFGYVSQAYLWLDRSLKIEQPLTSELPWPYPRESAAPLAFTPSSAGRIAPVYPAGVPLIMAGFILVFGACGPYLVAPVFGALLTAATYVLCRRLTGNRAAALIACLLMATSPAFLFNVMQPMSDTVAAALWTLSLCVLTWNGTPPAVVAGALSGLAILARPNLAPLAIAGAAMAGSVPRAAGYLLVGALPASIGIVLVNDNLYGSPFVSGYPVDRLYSFGYLPENIWRYVWWLLKSEWPALTALALPLVFWRGGFALSAERRTVLPLTTFAAFVLLSYAFYAPFDGWWYLRFLLPAFPLLFIAIAVVVVRCVPPLRPPARAAALAAFVVVAACVRVGLHAGEILAIGRGEDRYPAVAEFVARALPANSIIIAMQHSGTLRFYAGRPTLRYEWFEAGRLPSAIQWLRARGYRPYIVLENWEEPWFKRRFGSGGRIGELNVAIAGEFSDIASVRVYDPLLRPQEAPPPFQITARHGRCVAPSPRWRSVMQPDH